MEHHNNGTFEDIESNKNNICLNFVKIASTTHPCMILNCIQMSKQNFLKSRIKIWQKVTVTRVFAYRVSINSDQCTVIWRPHAAHPRPTSERLRQLRLYSQERRRERYAVIFLWKIANGLVSGYNRCEFSNTGRCGRICNVKDIPRTASAHVRRAKEASLAVKGANIFNMLPVEIRNITSDKVSSFKGALDKYLAKIPDEPTIEDQGRAAESNSLLHQIPVSRMQ